MPRQARAPTWLYRAYRAATALLLPLAYRSVARKLRRHGVPEARIAERRGLTGTSRPAGPLVWFHAASVGESLSVLALITRMGERLADTQFLITSGTATSAELIERRMPPRTRHQFAPLDAPGPVDRFYDHWHPDAGVFVESELWPGLLVQGGARGVPLALLNARLSEQSVRDWRKFPDTAGFVLDQFAILLTQNRRTADNLLAMGADPHRVQVGSNLKSTADPLPVDDRVLAQMRDAIGDRPVWIASSTHPGEETVVLEAHQHLLTSHPDLCLLLVPRHPERGDEVAALIDAAGLTGARRSAGEVPEARTQVYLADTLGELGIWYALSPIVFLGGSLLPIGGHNPFEPAQAGGAVITGPHVANFAETYAPLIATGGAVEVSDAPELARAVARWLEDTDELNNARRAAGEFVQARRAALDEVVDTLCAALELDDA